MKARRASAVGLLLMAGCAAPQGAAIAPQQTTQSKAPAALVFAQALPEEGTFEQRLRRRANEALDRAGAEAGQKSEIDGLLRRNSKKLFDCVGGSERRLIKTLSILASSENQGQALAGLEEADIPLSDLCFMLGSDLITQFSETLTEQQRQALVAEWRSMKSNE